MPEMDRRRAKHKKTLAVKLFSNFRQVSNVSIYETVNQSKNNQWRLKVCDKEMIDVRE